MRVDYALSFVFLFAFALSGPIGPKVFAEHGNAVFVGEDDSDGRCEKLERQVREINLRMQSVEGTNREELPQTNAFLELQNPNSSLNRNLDNYLAHIETELGSSRASYYPTSVSYDSSRVEFLGSERAEIESLRNPSLMGECAFRQANSPSSEGTVPATPAPTGGPGSEPAPRHRTPTERRENEGGPSNHAVSVDRGDSSPTNSLSIGRRGEGGGGPRATNLPEGSNPQVIRSQPTLARAVVPDQTSARSQNSVTSPTPVPTTTTPLSPAPANNPAASLRRQVGTPTGDYRIATANDLANFTTAASSWMWDGARWHAVADDTPGSTQWIYNGREWLVVKNSNFQKQFQENSSGAPVLRPGLRQSIPEGRTRQNLSFQRQGDRWVSASPTAPGAVQVQFNAGTGAFAFPTAGTPTTSVATTPRTRPANLVSVTSGGSQPTLTRVRRKPLVRR